MEVFVASHDISHPKLRLASASDHSEPYHFSAVRFVCQEAAISGSRLEQIREVSYEFTMLGVADDVLHAIGREHLLGSEIEIYANPAWSRRRVVIELNRRGCDTDEAFWTWVEF